MDFRLTKEEALFQKMCREFALNEVEPIAAEIDAEERYPEETVQKLMKYGLMGSNLAFLANLNLRGDRMDGARGMIDVRN